MAFGLNGNGHGGPQGTPLQRAADSAVLAVIGRLSGAAAVAILLAALAFIMPRAWDRFAELADRQAEIARILDRATWRLDRNEKLNEDQEQHLRSTDRRVNALERALPRPPRGWPGVDDDQ